MDNITAPVYHERFKDAPWYNKSLVTTVGGAGGIGSWLTLFLSRAGHEILLYDFDIVEPVNIGGQLYGMSHVGKLKTEATKLMVQLLCGEFKIHEMGKFGIEKEENDVVTNICFLAFDNMAARKLMAEAWFKHQESKKEKIPGEVNILIDGRMEAETGMVYAITSPKDFKRYMENDMFPDSDVPMAPCSYRGTSHNGARMGQEMINVLNGHITNKLRGAAVREVPYKIEYEMPTCGYEIIR